MSQVQISRKKKKRTKKIKSQRKELDRNHGHGAPWPVPILEKHKAHWAVCQLPAFDHPCAVQNGFFLKSPLHLGRHTHACPVSRCSFG